ncbi:hypothetical protein BWQ96_08637 [Gracilariopsis chorda]|uniref:Uncharacterized protein n=1 Tax=Gracilariopsis chorda TaxID=448386 RepID=A0A2V3IHQ7_9FLOR|nr:hypothetical protein BWQ96_08637 [Gracilariopsis chorda]|eukprot:PXF41626.1 hypothetical protein BWQ96_08637 [Gracilariopsis chorda]
MNSDCAAFVHSPFRPAQTRRSSVALSPVCSARGPARSAKRSLSALAAAVVSALALSPFGRVGVHVPCALAKELRYDGRQELDSKERAFSLALTGGTFAALGVWAWKQNRRDDQLEEVRIKDEVERLEKLRQEFLGVEEDEDSLNDEDFMASLRERLGEEERRADDDSSEPGAQPGDAGTAVKDKDTQDGAGSDSLDMLKRMWDATDDDAKPPKQDNES